MTQHDDKNPKRPVKPSEKKIDRFLSDLETEEGAKRWGDEAFKESKKTDSLTSTGK